jgi:hypothetical protein
MAYTPIVGSICEVAAQGVMAAAGSGAKNVASIFHYRLATLTAPATKVAIEQAFQTAIMIPFTNAASNRYTQSSTTIRWVDDAQDSPQAVTRAVAGAIATDSQPTLSAVYMLFRTAKRGKSYRGSKHFPAVSEVDTTGDILTGAGLALWQTLRTAVATALTDALGNVWNLSLLSRTLSTLTVNPTTVIANDVTSVLLNKTLGTMRRRRVATVR